MESHCHCDNNKMKVCCLGFSLGVVCALFLFMIALFVFWSDGSWGVALMNVLASYYMGYEASWKGAFIGAGWGLLDGFIAGVLIAWLYNMGCCFGLVCCKKSTCCESKSESKSGCCSSGS